MSAINAFAHESGIHQDGVLKHKQTYEIMNAELVGREAGVLVMGKHSGRHAFKKALTDMGYDLANDVPDYGISADSVDVLFKRFKDLADRKGAVNTDDIRALVENEVMKVAETYKLEHVQFQSGTGEMTPSALVRLSTPEGTLAETALGDGPVDASFKALAKMTPVPFVLESYDLKAIGKGTDALGEVSIRVNSEGQIVHGRAISTDVVHASVLAYVDVLNKLAAGVGRNKAAANQITMTTP